MVHLVHLLRMVHLVVQLSSLLLVLCFTLDVIVVPYRVGGWVAGGIENITISSFN